MMRRWCVGVAAALQLLTLVYMAAEREVVVRTGTVVRLRSAPVDPRDLFRGDFVRLSYQASTLPRGLWRDGLLTAIPKRDRKVYAVLRQGPDGLADVEAVTDIRPHEGLYLRGRVENAWSESVRVRYGLEAYFMQQGRALELERQRNREGIQVPLDMEVAVAGSGLAVIRGHQWGPLGLGLNLETRETTVSGRRQNEFTGVVTLRLLNASEKPLAVVDLPGGRSFRLSPETRWQQNQWQWVKRAEPPPAVAAEHVRVLAPGAVHSVRVDLADSAWFVEQPGKEGARTLRGLPDWNAWFRLIYAPPAAATCTGLENADRIWHGKLPSRAFNGMHGMD